MGANRYGQDATPPERSQEKQKCHFLNQPGSGFVEMFVRSRRGTRVRDLFAQGQAKDACIIFIDEIDAVGKVRASCAHIWRPRRRENTLNLLLVEMDGFDTRKGVILMAA